MSLLLNQTIGGEGHKVEFKFYKNQEIPEFHFSLEDPKGHINGPSDKAKAEDYVDFSITLIDNGDDKLCLEGNISIITLNNNSAPGGEQELELGVPDVHARAREGHEGVDRGQRPLRLPQGGQDQAGREVARVQERAHQQRTLRMLLLNFLSI
jgi:hypothetical protein